MADRIDWDYFEQAFAGHYSHTGQPATPIRFMVGRLMRHPTRRVILAIKSFEGNPHDSKTIEPLLAQIASDRRPLPREVIHDRGGRGIKGALGGKSDYPDQAHPSDSAAKKRRMRRRFRRRAGIKPLIGHLKTDHRLRQNYLHGEESPHINAYLVAAGWNLKKWMEQWVRDGKNGCILHGHSLPVNTIINPF